MSIHLDSNSLYEPEENINLFSPKASFCNNSYIFLKQYQALLQTWCPRGIFTIYPIWMCSSTKHRAFKACWLTTACQHLCSQTTNKLSVSIIWIIVFAQKVSSWDLNIYLDLNKVILTVLLLTRKQKSNSKASLHKVWFCNSISCIASAWFMASNELYYVRWRTKLGLSHEVRFQKGTWKLNSFLSASCHSTPPICTISLVADTALKELGICTGRIYASGLVLRALG